MISHFLKNNTSVLKFYKILVVMFVIAVFCFPVEMVLAENPADYDLTDGSKEFANWTNCTNCSCSCRGISACGGTGGGTFTYTSDFTLPAKTKVVITGSFVADDVLCQIVVETHWKTH